MFEIDIVKDIIRKCLDLKPDVKIADDCVIQDALKADSLDAIEIAMAIEADFGCLIPDSAIKEMRTPAKCLAVAKRYMKEQVT